MAIVVLTACSPGRLEISSGQRSGPDDGIRLADASTFSPPRSEPDGSVTRADGGAAPAPAPPTVPQDECGDLRVDGLVYFGSRTPTYLALTEGQTLAIGMLDLGGGGLCSGLLIHPRFVLTAAHCARSGARFLMGPEGNRPIASVQVRRFINHSRRDIALAELESDATEVLSSVTPIPVTLDDLDSSWRGRETEASGYGRTESGTVGTRYFSHFPISEVSGPSIVINAGGRGGVCNGDSGGPIMVRTEDAGVRVIGVVSTGDGTCTYEARFSRADQVRPWIEGHTGPTPRGLVADCETLGHEGRCLNGQPTWCEGDRVESEICGAGMRCGWEPATSGYRCVPNGSDACGGVDSHGTCRESRAVWCDRGELRERNCGACGETCGEVPSAGGIYCRPDPCMGLDYHGQCVGARVEYCRDGEFRTRDCAADGLRCGWVNDELGYWCH